MSDATNRPQRVKTVEVGLQEAVYPDRNGLAVCKMQNKGLIAQNKEAVYPDRNRDVVVSSVRFNDYVVEVHNHHLIITGTFAGGCLHEAKHHRDIFGLVESTPLRAVLFCIARLDAAFPRQIERLTLLNPRTVMESIYRLKRLGLVVTVDNIKANKAAQAMYDFVRQHQPTMPKTQLKFYQIRDCSAAFVKEFCQLIETSLTRDFLTRLGDYKRETLKRLAEVSRLRKQFAKAHKSGQGLTVEDRNWS